MSKKSNVKDVEIIIQYENNTEKKEEKTLQQIMQRLFNLYLTKLIQNFNKGK